MAGGPSREPSTPLSDGSTENTAAPASSETTAEFVQKSSGLNDGTQGARIVDTGGVAVNTTESTSADQVTC